MLFLSDDVASIFKSSSMPQWAAKTAPNYPISRIVIPKLRK